MKKTFFTICAVLLALVLVFTVPKAVRAILPADLSDVPEVHLGESKKDMIQRLGAATVHLTDIIVWHNEKWTLVCGFHDGLRDYHLVDRYGRWIDGTIKKEDTVRHILQELYEHPFDEGIETAYETASGVVRYGKIGYDGGIVLFSTDEGREIYDYTRINDERPYVFTFVWSFYLEHLLW